MPEIFACAFYGVFATKEILGFLKRHEAFLTLHVSQRRTLCRRKSLAVGGILLVYSNCGTSSLPGCCIKGLSVMICPRWPLTWRVFYCMLHIAGFPSVNLTCCLPYNQNFCSSHFQGCPRSSKAPSKCYNPDSREATEESQKQTCTERFITIRAVQRKFYCGVFKRLPTGDRNQQMTGAGSDEEHLHTP